MRSCYLLILLLAVSASANAQSPMTVAFDKDVVSLFCDIPVRSKNASCPEGGTVVNVAAHPTDEYKTISYLVSGGRIIGGGVNVVWDLNNVRPGYYRLTAVLANARGIVVQRIRKVILVQQCPDCDPPCICYPLSVGSEYWRIKPEGELTFKAFLGVGSLPRVRYRWTVTGGTIVVGQGSPVLTVRADASGPVVANVEIFGLDPSCNCPTAASHTVPIGIPTEINRFSSITRLRINRTKLQPECGAEEALIDVVANAVDAENDFVSYKYFISGGSITDTGESARWNLVRAKPGEYWIIAAADDGSGVFGRTMRRTVRVLPCK